VTTPPGECLHQLENVLDRLPPDLKNRTVPLPRIELADVFNRAPSGTTPKSTQRQRSMTNRLAIATMPIRRIRLPALANRCLYHRLNFA